MKNLLKVLFFTVLTLLVINNTYKTYNRPNIYINNEVIEKIKSLSYTPINVMEANVIVMADKGRGSGSVIKIDKTGSYILTAAHVIHEVRYKLIKKNKIEQIGTPAKIVTIVVGKKQYKGIVLKEDSATDLAVIKIYKKLKVKPIKIAKVRPQFGETVWAITNPGGLTNIINKGVYSSINDNNAIVSVAGYFGSSGGMVLNNGGEQIGIVSSVYTTTISNYFPNITMYNGITKTDVLNKFLKGIL